MDTGWFGNAGTLSGSVKQQLDRMGGNGFILFCPFKQPLRGAISPPVVSQLLQGRLGQNGVTILASLALSDPDHHSLTIDIGELKACCLAHSQSRGIRHHQDGLVLEILGNGKEGLDLREVQNHRKFSLGPRIADFLHRPFPFQRRSVQEFKARHIEPEGSLGQMPLLDQVNQIRLEFVFSQLLRGFAKVFGQVLGLSQVGPLRARLGSTQLKVYKHPISQRSHNTTSFDLDFRQLILTVGQRKLYGDSIRSTRDKHS